MSLNPILKRQMITSLDTAFRMLTLSLFEEMPTFKCSLVSIFFTPRLFFNITPRQS